LLRVSNGDSSSTSEESNKVTEFQLMLFELELNHTELKSGIIQVEGRKEFIENNIKVVMKECKPPVDDNIKDRIKLDIK